MHFSEITYQSITLFKRAEINPTMLKLSSVAVQSDSPAIMGRRDRFTNKVDLSPVTQQNKSTKLIWFVITINNNMHIQPYFTRT